MLIRFTVENFLSFNGRQVFSMIPGKGTLKKNHKARSVNGISLLKAGVIFGANASGKSNLVKAVAFGKRMVILGQKQNNIIDYSKFRLNSNAMNANSRLEFEIQTNGHNYAYGFVFNNQRIEEEWLYEVKKDSEKLIFERNSSLNEQYNIEPLLNKNKNKDHQQFLKFSTKGTPDNQLFLHDIISRKVKDNVDDISDIINVYNWFANTLKVIFPEDKYKEGIQFELVENDKLRNIFDELLHYFGTGIDGICLQPMDIKEVRIPNIVLDKIKEDLLKSPQKNMKTIVSSRNYTYFISLKDNDLQFQKFMTLHKVLDRENPEFFDTRDESDGTNRIIDYIPLIVDLLNGNNVFLIDEMERSLHPNLIYDIIDLFLDFSDDGNSQLIIASHESSLLTQKLYRKDEIWFTVKNNFGETQLHSLEEYNVRFDKEIRKDYLLGRFKAIPRLGNRYELNSLK